MQILISSEIFKFMASSWVSFISFYVFSLNSFYDIVWTYLIRHSVKYRNLLVLVSYTSYDKIQKRDILKQIFHFGAVCADSHFKGNCIWLYWMIWWLINMHENSCRPLSMTPLPKDVKWEVHPRLYDLLKFSIG